MSRPRLASIDRIIREGSEATRAVVRIAEQGASEVDSMLAEFLMDDVDVDTAVKALRELVPALRPSDVPTKPDGRRPRPDPRREP